MLTVKIFILAEIDHFGNAPLVLKLVPDGGFLPRVNNTRKIKKTSLMKDHTLRFNKYANSMRAIWGKRYTELRTLQICISWKHRSGIEPTIVFTQIDDSVKRLIWQYQLVDSYQKFTNLNLNRREKILLLMMCVFAVLWNLLVKDYLATTRN